MILSVAAFACLVAGCSTAYAPWPEPAARDAEVVVDAPLLSDAEPCRPDVPPLICDVFRAAWGVDSWDEYPMTCASPPGACIILSVNVQDYAGFRWCCVEDAGVVR